MAKKNAPKKNDFVAQFPGLMIIHQKIPAQEVGRHTHSEHEFFLPLQGEISVHSVDTEAKAGPGKLLYVPPQLDHSFTSSAQGSGERVIWLIDDKLWKKHTNLNFKPTAFSHNSLAKEILFYLLLHPSAEGAKYFISALLAALIDSLKSAQVLASAINVEHLGAKVQDARVRQAVEMLVEKMSDITIPQVAKECGLSSRNFSRLFLQEAGMSAKDFLILSRVSRAKELLLQSRMTITDISMEVGYNSLSKFIDTFRKITGVLPSDFRNQAQPSRTTL